MTISLRYRHDQHDRPPDWKWHRAGEILAEGTRVTPAENASGLSSLVWLRRRLETARTRQAMLRACFSFEPLFRAYELYSRSEMESTRCEIEARILARESFAEIADKTCADPTVVQMFEECFFNVLDRLDSPSYVVNVVLRRSVAAGLATREFDCLLKMLGYWLGPAAVDLMVYHAPPGNRATTADELLDTLEKDTRSTIALKAMLAARMMPINWQTQSELLKLQTRILESERSRSGPDIATEAILENVKEFVESMPFTRREYRPGDAPKNVLEAIEESGVGFRADELLRLGVGDMPKSLKVAWETARYPEAPE